MSTFAGPQLGTRRLSTSAPSPSASLASAEAPTRLGVKLLAVYVYLVTGRALDVSRLWVLHIPMIMLILLIVMTFAGGNIKHAMSSSISKYFLAFTIWVVVCYPFSYWR